LPVEVAQFGWQATAGALERLGSRPELRFAARGQPFVTDGGNFISIACSADRRSAGDRTPDQVDRRRRRERVVRRRSSA